VIALWDSHIPTLVSKPKAFDTVDEAIEAAGHGLGAWWLIVSRRAVQRSMRANRASEKSAYLVPPSRVADIAAAALMSSASITSVAGLVLPSRASTRPRLSSPRCALFRMPPLRRARNTCSSVSLIVPLSTEQ
jgi:hypothetical protein